MQSQEKTRARSFIAQAMPPSAVQSIQDITTRFIEYLSKRDVTNLMALFGERVDWFVPGDHTKASWIGARTTKAEVEEFFQMLWQNAEPLAVRIDDVFYETTRSVIAGEFSSKMKLTGKIVTSIFFIYITVSDGLITRYRLLEDSHSVSEALTP